MRTSDGPSVAPPAHFVRRPQAWAGVLVIAYFALQVSSGYQLWEDAYFYLRYAQNFAEGYGLVYNPGEYYEANTNFLWSVLLVLPFVVSMDPFLFIKIANGLITCAVLILVYLITARLADRLSALLAVVLVASHWTFFIIGHTGFMPYLPVMLALAAIYYALRYADNPSGRKALAVGTALSFMALTRLDAQLMFWPIIFLAAFFVWRCRSGRLPHALLACFLPVFVFGVYLLCKQLYYGDILPASYYAKIGSKIPEEYGFLERGVLYNLLYVCEYLFVVFMPIAAFLALQRVRKTGFAKSFQSAGSQALVVCLAIAILQFAYMLRTGGGSEEFRFHAVSAPFIFILLIQGMWRERTAAAVAAAAMIGASFLHAATYQQDRTGFAVPMSVSMLVKQEEDLRMYAQRAKDLGEFFSELFPYPPGIKVATTSGGVIPFHLRLHVIEMHGWTDTRIQEAGNHVLQPHHPIAGHQFLASPDFLLREGVNIIFGSPRFVDENVYRTADPQSLVGVLTMTGDLAQRFDFPSDMKIIGIPMPDGSVLLGLYAIRDKRLDELFIRKGMKWRDL